MGQEEYTTRYQCHECQESKAARVLTQLTRALASQGYDPVSQLVGYLLSGDPTYITKKDNARASVRTIQRDELLEELVRQYIATKRVG
jgi:uncharacterized protein (UPF0297 family)